MRVVVVMCKCKCKCKCQALVCVSYTKCKTHFYVPLSTRIEGRIQHFCVLTLNRIHFARVTQW